MDLEDKNKVFAVTISLYISVVHATSSNMLLKVEARFVVHILYIFDVTRLVDVTACLT